MLSQDELPALHEVAHSKVVVEKVLNEKLEHLVVELEGEGGVDQHPLDHLVQAAGRWWRPKSVEGKVASGSLEKNEDSIEGKLQEKKNLSKRSVQGGKGGGNAKDKDNRELRIAREEEDEVLHRGSCHRLKLLDDDHQGGFGSFAVFSRIPGQLLKTDNTDQLDPKQFFQQAKKLLS